MRPQHTPAKGAPKTGVYVVSGTVPRHQEKTPKCHTAEAWGGHGMSRQGHIKTMKIFSYVEEQKLLTVLLASTDVVYI